MIQIEDKIISLDVFERHFLCDLNTCKGECCVKGDAGAPLLEEEKNFLEKNLDYISPYMEQKSLEIVEKQGIGVVDLEGELTTNLVDNKECVFVKKYNGINKCSIENAFREKKISFKKPISCHLFPIRIKEHSNFDAINYEEIDVCKSACRCGVRLNIPVYVFLKQALIRKYGEEWYKKLLKTAHLLKKS